jgi:hypothetical protein
MQLDKYDVANKGQLDNILQNNHFSILQLVGKIVFVKEDHGIKAVNLLSFSFDGLEFFQIAINV